MNYVKRIGDGVAIKLTLDGQEPKYYYPADLNFLFNNNKNTVDIGIRNEQGVNSIAAGQITIQDILIEVEADMDLAIPLLFPKPAGSGGGGGISTSGLKSFTTAVNFTAIDASPHIVNFPEEIKTENSFIAWAFLDTADIIALDVTFARIDTNTFQVSQLPGAPESEQLVIFVVYEPLVSAGGGGAASRFGIEDNLGVQDRINNLGNYSLDIVSGTPDFQGTTSEIYIDNTSAALYSKDAATGQSNITTGSSGGPYARMISTNGIVTGNVIVSPPLIHLFSFNPSEQTGLKITPSTIEVLLNAVDNPINYKYLPLSVNNNFADSTGNITIAAEPEFYAKLGEDFIGGSLMPYFKKIFRNTLGYVPEITKVVDGNYIIKHPIGTLINKLEFDTTFVTVGPSAMLNPGDDWKIITDTTATDGIYLYTTLNGAFQAGAIQNNNGVDFQIKIFSAPL